MDDLISRQAAIDEMTNTLWHYPNECYRNLNEYEFAKGLAELGLKSVPSAQPEIVRCKDCRFLIDEGDGYMCGNSTSYVVGTDVEFGCVLAERRTDG